MTSTAVTPPNGTPALPWYKAGWLRTLVTAVAVSCAPLLCGLIPNPVGAAVCNTAVRAAAGVFNATPPTDEESKAVCPDILCTAVAGPPYDVRLPDGGVCLCSPAAP